MNANIHKLPLDILTKFSVFSLMQGQFCPSSRSGTAAWNNYTQVLHNHDEYFVLTKSSSYDPGNLGLTTVMSSFHVPHIDFKLLDAYPEEDGANSSGSTKMSLL